jgi:hypothetical protein
MSKMSEKQESKEKIIIIIINHTPLHQLYELRRDF